MGKRVCASCVGIRSSEWRRGLFLLLAFFLLLPVPASAQPTISLSPTSLSFGTLNVGASASQIITLSNNGTATLSVGSISSR